MSQSICMYCGEIKTGALCECDICGNKPMDIELSCVLTDHYLSDDEIEKISSAIKVIKTQPIDDDTRFLLLSYYLYMKWPKIIDFDANNVDAQVMKTIDYYYENLLSYLPGQTCLSERLENNITDTYWDSAQTEDLQKEEDAWLNEVIPIVFKGVEISKNIIGLKISLGEGAVFQRIKHRIQGVFINHNYLEMKNRGEMLKREVSAYERCIENFCSRVKNGWSQRTINHSAYLRGIYSRMHEMVDFCVVISNYKLGINDIVHNEYKTTLQKFRKSCEAFMRLINVCMRPEQIQKGIHE